MRTLKKISAWILTLILLVPSAGTALAEVTSKDSGPVKPHTPQAYTYDMATDKITDAAGNYICTGMNDTPILFPGDTMKFKPEGSGDERMTGFIFNDPDSAESRVCKDGKIHVEVTDTVSHVGKKFITGIKIVGEEPVRLQSWGGGARAVEDDYSVKYYCKNLAFVYIPGWCQVTTELSYSFNGERLMTEEEAASAAYYTGPENSTTRIWAEDSIYNALAEKEDKLSFSVYRPYIEGFFYSGYSDYASEDSSHQISPTVYRYQQSETWHGNFWEGWLDNEIEIIPFTDNWYGKREGYADYGTYEDELLVRLKYKPGRTLTFDACGGTIEGYPTRIYEAEGRQYFNQDLEAGNVDQAIAEGRGYIPVREGYVFAGWYEDKEYTTPVESFKDLIARYSTNPYDEWEAHICRVYAKWINGNVAKAKVTGVKAATYTGKAIKPTPTVKSGDYELIKGTDYKLSYSKNKNAGTAKVMIIGKGDFYGKKTVKFKIKKAAQPMKVTPKTATVKYTKLKTKKQTLSIKKVMKVKSAKGTVTYAKKSGSKKITVNKKTGKITLAKGLKKGTYKVKIQVTAKGTSNYKKGSKTVTVKIKVK